MVGCVRDAGSLATISQDSLEFVRSLSQHQRGMFIRKPNLGATTLMLLDPNNLFGIDVHILFLDVGYFNQNAHESLPEWRSEKKQILT
jgi:hypothetical protein